MKNLTQLLMALFCLCMPAMLYAQNDKDDDDDDDSGSSDSGSNDSGSSDSGSSGGDSGGSDVDMDWTPDLL